jgi:geranylgeranyl pyrophosphate synthase
MSEGDLVTLLEDGLRRKQELVERALAALFATDVADSERRETPMPPGGPWGLAPAVLPVSRRAPERSFLTDGDVPQELLSALRRSLFPGGKRLRPVCVLATAELLGRAPEDLLGLACAVELVHSASLILDDLPSMDNAALRRGQPALHIEFGEATAILAAIALLTRSFELLAEAGRQLRLSRETEAALVSELAQAVGARGMAAGQQMDLTAKVGREDLTTIESIHNRKTGCLFVAAFRVAALALGADELSLEALTGFGRNLGLAFQVTDDILSVTAGSEQLGKSSAREDPLVNLATLFGVEAARTLAGELVQTAQECLTLFGPRGDFLRALARFVLDRRQ